MRFKEIALAFFTGIFLVLSQPVACQGLTVDGLTGIYLAGQLTEIEKETVSFLQDGLKRFYNVNLKVLEERPTGPAIILGRNAALKEKLVTSIELESLKPDGYFLLTTKDHLVIAGPDQWATYYGVIGFFERCGAKFLKAVGGKFTPWPWFPPYFPENPERKIPNLSVKEKPVFAYRCGGCPVFRQTRLADPKKGADPELFDPKKTGSNLWIDHTAGYLV
ncbi:MAG: glycoside hydrolase family 20 zincin-like fold domain-containing protein, partial [Candidatus Omnitrophica bacterium]|nr:glycoside hydrolase family 20 zincin-like fold domain-containing protein [Candidatus Omnitrophota bacterium]